jgi:hypothetical protein
MQITETRLVDALHFTGHHPHERCVATITDISGHLGKNDVVHFPVRGELVPFRVEARISNSVQLVRDEEENHPLTVPAGTHGKVLCPEPS